MKVQVDGAELEVQDSGGAGPAVVFSHGLLWSTKLYRYQTAALSKDFRCIAYDHRGQGKSEVTRAGYDMETLTLDAAALIEKLVKGPVHFVGLSMGGFVGMRLAARRPELVRSLALIETAPDKEPLLGIRPLVPAVMKIMFGGTFLADPARAALREELQAELAANDLTGMRRAVDGVLFRKPVSAEELARIRCPTAVISGEEDHAVRPERSRKLQQAIPGATFVPIPRAGHSSSLEEPEAINAALRELWARR